MSRQALQDASSRVAFAAFLHDLGKLAQRARVFEKDPRRDAHLTLYCPYHQQKGGYFSHQHAADTALAFDVLEAHLPELLKGDPSPFAPPGSENVTDSLINAAAAHHKPETFLQWIVATADRVASGFERSEFEAYNAAEEPEHGPENFRSARLLVRFEEYGRGKVDRADLRWRYPIQPLSPGALMPVPVEKARGEATEAYARLWDALVAEDGRDGIGRTPKSHRAQWPLWLDHFDTLWLTVAHAIPSATAGDTRPDVSLYDHSRTTAALATALWRYHREGDQEAARLAMASRADWEDPKFLLVQGDFSGIQNFVFGGDSIVQKKAAKLLRGRSALVSLLTELAALAVLDALALPPTSQVINAAGRFLIVAPNLPETEEALGHVRARLDAWFLERMFGLSGLVLATAPAACNDFVGKGRYSETMKRLFASLERAKRQMFALAAADAPAAVRVAEFPDGPCQFDSRLPAEPGLEVDQEPAHALTAAAIALGKALADPDMGRLLVFRAGDAPAHADLLPLEIFGYRVLPTGDREETGNFGEQAQSGALRRAFDIRLPDADLDAVAWSGYARRALSAFVPVHGHQPEADGRFDGLEPAERGAIKTFEHLARSDQTKEQDRRFVGVEALGVLKGDIDDLGAFFAAQGERPSFARWAELSRRVNAFFTLWLPSRMARDPAFRNVYTVFAGGDDFFFVGPWRTLRKFAWALREDFRRYVAGNAALHFSAGYVMAKPGHPVRQLAREAEEALEAAKGGAKNAFALHGATFSWDDWKAQVEDAIDALERHISADKLSHGYLYGLLQLAEMAADSSRPENMRWRSRLYYQTRRHFERNRCVPKDDREARALALIDAVGVKGLEGRPDALRVALFDQLYARRD